MGMTLVLNPENAAKSLISHLEALRREEDFIADVYRRYDGLKSLDAALAAAGVLDEIKAIAAQVEG